MAASVRRKDDNTTPGEVDDLVRQIRDRLRERLPDSWRINLQRKGEDTTGAPAASPANAVITVTTPIRTEGAFTIAARQSIPPRDLPLVLARAQTAAAERTTAEPMVVAHHLSKSAREWLETRGVSYADSTGNVYARIDGIALFVQTTGAELDPRRGAGRRPGGLRGVPAARVVRALVDIVPPYRPTEIARVSGAAIGTTYRVLEFLDAEALIERTARGPITGVAWRRIIDRWGQDYGFLSDNTVRTVLAVRGIPELLSRLAEQPEIKYAVSGSHAAHQWETYAPGRAAMVYVADDEEVLTKLDLRAVDTGGNVMLAIGDKMAAFDRTFVAAGIRYVAPSQAAVDLLTGPGRSPSEAVALLDWMEKHESRWRQPLA